MANFTFEKKKVFRLQDINENVSGNGNHKKAYTVRYRQPKYTKLLHTSKPIDCFN